MSGLVQIRRARATTPAPSPPALAEPRDDRPAGPRASQGRVYLETFGCQMNEADTALIAGQLARAGYERVDDPAAADVVLINTCAIREKAEERVWGRASQLLDHRRRNPGLVIGITGCMAEHLREKVASRAPHISLIAGPDSYRRIGSLVAKARAGRPAIDVALDRSEVYEDLEPHPDDDGISGFVSVQRGCDKFCSFCVVPFTRGRERGLPPRAILRQIRAMAERGYREVTLLGQTVNSYRWEDVDFAGLLGAVCEVDGIARVRFTSPHPSDFTPRLVERLAREPKLMPYLHLPVQSGSDAVLERMRRGYTAERFLSLVGELRAAIPDLALSTDLMVGFCGETDDDHRRTLDLMREVRFESAFMFAYSDRGVTFAARRLIDDVPDAVKQARLREVIELQEAHTRAAHEARVGRTEEVLVQAAARRSDGFVGRSRRFQRVLLPAGQGAPGELRAARIVRTTGHTLIAE